MTPALRDREFSADEPVKVSICAITFNHEDYIAQCLEGFLDQVCDFRVEILIHDDASTDRTADIIRDYAARYPMIFRTILQTENQYSKGVNPHFAYVMPDARGDYIAFCDGDDFWCDPQKLATQVAVLDSEPDVALTYGTAQGISEEGEPVAYVGGIEHDLSPTELKKAPPINTLTACFRNIFRGTTPSLFIRTATIGDLMVWSMLGYHGGGRYLSNLKPAFYRVHANGLLSMKTRERQHYMTAIAHMHLAAFHEEQSDPEAATAALQLMFQHSQSMVRVLPPKPLFKLWRRAFKNKLLGR